MKARQAAQREKTNRKRGESHHNARTGPGPKFILSGILKCADCGGGFIIVSPGKYKCSNAHRRGTSICINTATLSKNDVEEKLLASLKEDLFSHEAVETFRAEVASLLKQRKLDFEPAVKKIKAQLKDVDIKISNLIDVLETKGLESSLVTNRLADLEQQRSKLEKDLGLQMSHIQDVEPFIPRAVDRYHELIANLPESCKEHTAPVREKLSSLLGGQVMLRKSEHGGWEGTYRGSYAGLIRLGAAHIEISDETLSGRFF